MQANTDPRLPKDSDKQPAPPEGQPVPKVSEVTAPPATKHSFIPQFPLAWGPDHPQQLLLYPEAGPLRTDLSRMRGPEVFRLQPIQLASGLPVYIFPETFPADFEIKVSVRAGATSDPLGKSGLAHFLEHLLLKNSIDGVGQAQLERERRTNYVRTNGVTSFYATGFEAKGRHASREFGIETLAPIFVPPAFAEADLQHEKVIVQAEDIAVQRPNYLRVFHEQGTRFLFGERRNLGSVLGTPPELDSITSADLESFWRQHYRADNMAVFIRAHDPDRVLRRLESLASQLTAHNISSVSCVEHALQPRQGAGPEVLNLYANSDGHHVFIGMPSLLPNHSDFAALLVLKFMLAGSPASYLLEGLRSSRPLTYSVDLYSLYGQMGEVAEVLQVALASPQHLDEVSKVIQEVYGDALQGKLNGMFFERAQSAVQDQYRFAGNLNWWQDSFLACGQPVPVDQVFQSVSDVTLEDVHRVAVQVLNPAAARTVVIGRGLK
jgi:predicted Zn-dependent peptidase